MVGMQEKVDAILSRMEQACRRAGRGVDEVRLLAVSKTYPPERVREAVDCGLTVFGESRIPEAEAKILKVQKMLDETHPVDIVSTFLGAHAIPSDYSVEEYISLLLDVMIPEVSGKARFCDVFCEKGFFNLDQSRKILEAGKKYGLIPKIHADELSDTGGAVLAAEVGAISADHLLMVSKQGMKAMVSKGVIGVMLPGTPFSMMLNRYAPARELIDIGVPLALATDLNPNCYCENMQFMIQLACLGMHMTPEEAICAATYNAACAIGEENRVGSIESGKKADIIILDIPSYKFLPYHFGVNLVETVIKNGIIIYSSLRS